MPKPIKIATATAWLLAAGAIPAGAQQPLPPLEDPANDLSAEIPCFEATLSGSNGAAVACAGKESALARELAQQIVRARRSLATAEQLIERKSADPSCAQDEKCAAALTEMAGFKKVFRDSLEGLYRRARAHKLMR